MVPVNRKNVDLAQEAAQGMTSLLNQGGVVLVGFLAMLVLTGGAPSGLAVGLTVGLSGVFVTWSEQRRLTYKNKVIRRHQDNFASQSLLENCTPDYNICFTPGLSFKISKPKLKSQELAYLLLVELSNYKGKLDDQIFCKLMSIILASLVVDDLASLVKDASEDLINLNKILFESPKNEILEQLNNFHDVN